MPMVPPHKKLPGPVLLFSTATRVLLLEITMCEVHSVPFECTAIWMLAAV